ncbi:MAG: response regulator [Duodenibacillus sp.]|nr:response regulator [Duodenibacillus sp.]
MSNLPSDLIRIVDDDPTVCASLTFVLQIAGFDVVSYNSADQFLSQASGLRPGCILLDVKMPGKSGLELFQELRRNQDLQLPVIFLTGHGDIEMAVQALHEGAFDFLVKPADPQRLLAIVTKAVELSKTLRRERREAREIEELMAKLTPAELQVAQMMAKGLTVKTIAQALEVSEQAVKSHRSSIYHKLDAINPVEVAVIVNDWLRGRQ